MRIHLLEKYDLSHIPANVGETLLVGDRKMKVTEVVKVDENTNRLTLED